MSESRNVSGWSQSFPVCHRVGGVGTLLSTFFQTLDTTLGQTVWTLPATEVTKISSLLV